MGELELSSEAQDKQDKQAEQTEKMRQGEIGAETLKHTFLGNWGEGAEAAPVWLLFDSIPICGGGSAHTYIHQET